MDEERREMEVAVYGAEEKSYMESETGHFGSVVGLNCYSTLRFRKNCRIINGFKARAWAWKLTGTLCEC
jgi:hypothetical protein